MVERGASHPAGPAVPGGSPVFFAAIAAIALHLFADAFTGLEQGVSPGDHLTAVLVPSAVLAASLLAWPRVGAGARAAIALALGFLALIGGGVAVAGLGEPGLDPAVLTGLLLIPAGAALIWLGVALLWRTRKPTGRPWLRRALIGLAAAFVWFELLLPIALALVATHRPAGEPAPPDLGRPAQEVRLQTGDGIEIAGSYAPSRNGAAVITFPDREGTAPHARMLAGAGYGVLAIDARGYGASGGDPNAYGWGDVADIEAAVDWLESRPDVSRDRIGGLGLSVGGEQMIEAAAGDERLAAVVSDGAGERSVRETLLFGPEAALAIPQSAVLTGAVAVFSGEAPPPALDDLAARIAPRALLLIEAEEGQGGEELNSDYLEAAGDTAELWVVPGAAHTDGIETAPDEYRRRVVGFFDEALGVTRDPPPR